MAFKSTCCYCGTGCGVLVHRERGGAIRVEGDPEHPVNRGMLCSKGMNLHHTVQDLSDRILHPRMRASKGAPAERVDWNTAMDRAASTFASIIRRWGPEAVAFYVSGQCLTEEYYVANKLVKGFLGCNNIDTNSRLCMSSAVVGYKLSLGEDSVPVCYDDIELADCFLVAGANPAWCHPILWRRVEARKRAHPEVRIIVADPRATQTCESADLHLPLLPGTDVALFNGLARTLLEYGLEDRAFLEAHVEGFDAFQAVVLERSIAEWALACGVPEQDLRQAALWIGRSRGFLTLWAMGLNQSAVGVDKNLALINLNLLTGQIGKPGAGPFSLTGQPNAMGGREVGGLANLLPAHRDLSREDHRLEVQAYWKSGPIAAKPGLTATELIPAIERGELKALWVICTNPMVSLPDLARAEAAFARLPFLVVQDVSERSDTVPFADLVLPAAAWAEKEGTMTNSERRITHLSPVVPPPGEALPDAEILCRFARRMGFPGFEDARPETIFREHAELTRGTRIDISRLDYATLREKGSVQWPYLEPGQGQERLFQDGVFATASGRAKLHPCRLEHRSDVCTEAFPLILTTGRIRDQWHTMTKTGKVKRLGRHIPRPFLEIHPSDARARGLREDDVVEVQSPRGTTRVRAQITADIRPGVVFLPMHWGRMAASTDGRANNLTNPLFDLRSKEPDLKYSAVQVRRHRAPAQRIAVVGAGAGGYAFAREALKRLPESEITVFSREQDPFYDRVMLPDYVGRERRWDELLKVDLGGEDRLTVHAGLGVARLDLENSRLIDARGGVHAFDVLVMATGSRPALPKGTPVDRKGLFSIRTRGDAEALMAHLKPASTVVIVGGGLLGIEMAGALLGIGHRIVLVQRSSRLMDRQLDPTAAGLLHEELVERGVEILYEDEVRSYGEGPVISEVLLRSGRRIACDAALVAVGTTPNLELAREAGLHCRRGVVVDGFLATSHPQVYALGEIAEFEGSLYGITAAAEEQAMALVRHLEGDPTQPYTGSLGVNILKIPGLEVRSIGLAESPGPEYEEVVFLDRPLRTYKKCIVHQGRLVGAILVGDKTEFTEFRELIRDKLELSEKRLTLLRGGVPAQATQGRLVCSCQGVGEGNLEAACRAGASTLEALAQATGAGTGCGSCRPEVAKFLAARVVPSLEEVSA